MRRRDLLRAAAACGAAVALTLGLRGLYVKLAAIRLSSFDAVIRPLLAQMTLDEKLGQMTQGELNQIRDESDIERYFLGSVLSGGGADPSEGNGLAAWTETVDRLIRRSMQTRLRIPILYGVDAVHGHGNVDGAVIFPHNVGLGCTNNAALVEDVARVTAIETRATGIQWTFAPCVTVPRDIRWGRTYEGYSESPDIVSRLGAAAIRGLQSADLNSPLAVLACAKHYIGDGGTAYQPHEIRGRLLLLDQGDAQMDEAALRRIHLPAYAAAVAAGVGSIMVSYNSWNGLKVSGIHRLLTGILKDELGFEGFLISDYNAIGQVDPDFKIAIMKSVNAGMDMAMEPARYRLFIQNLKELVGEGRVPIARIDDAVTRILRVKWAMGLMDRDRSQLADRRLHEAFGSARHRDVARRAVRESLVLLKNANHRLPLARTAARIHLAGRGADDIGIQCGGWTVQWQGQAGNVTSGGTTLLAAIKAGVSTTTTVTHSADGSGAAGADVAIVVVGELPYAEGVGDRRDLALIAEDVALVDTVAATGTPIVLVIFSGRPVLLGAVLDRLDAVLAAWLPGSEAQGIADVLLGDHAPTGKLGFRWPQSMAQIPVGAGDGEDAPLFPIGFGLSW